MMKKTLLLILIIFGLSYSTQSVAEVKNLEQLKNLNIATALKNLPNICKYRFREKYSGKEKTIVLIRSSLWSSFGEAFYSDKELWRAESKYKGISGDAEGIDEIIKILSKDPSLIFSIDFRLSKLKCHNFAEPYDFGYPFREQYNHLKPKNGLFYGRYPVENYFGRQTSVILIKPYDDKTYARELSAWEKGEYKLNKAYLNNIKKNLNPIDKENLKFLVNIITLNSNTELPATVDKKTKKTFKINFGNLKTAYDKLQNNETYQFVKKVNNARVAFKILLLLL